MSVRKIPPARKFPKRLSQEELSEKTTNYMNSLGAENFYKARYYCESAPIIIGQKSPKFFSLQPAIRHSDGKNEAWNKAYSIVLDYLESNKMEFSLQTIKTEFGKTGIPKDFPKIETGQKSKIFNQLFGISSDLNEITFDQKVQEMIENNDE